ncbi:MAG: DUF6908 domain-containing protein [Desulfovibrionales bacterium]
MPPKEEVYRGIYDRMSRLVNQLEGNRKVFPLHNLPPLVVERVEDNSYKIGQYYEISPGELLALPEMLVLVDHERQRGEALYYRHDSLGVFNEVYIQRNGKYFVDLKEQNQQNRFLEQWLINMDQRGLFSIPEEEAASIHQD